MTAWTLLLQLQGGNPLHPCGPLSIKVLFIISLRLSEQVVPSPQQDYAKDSWQRPYLQQLC